MNNPFEVLGLKGWADQDEIRAAYRTLVKQCHPDMIQDPSLKEEAQMRMVQLNLAYEEALRLASPRPQAPAGPETTVAEAVLMAERSLARDNPEAALRHNVGGTEAVGEAFRQMHVRKGGIQRAIGESLILLAPVEVGPAFDTPRQMEVHLAFGEPRQRMIQEPLHERTAFLAVHFDSPFPARPSLARIPCKTARALKRRDITVPCGTSSISAISAMLRSSK